MNQNIADLVYAATMLKLISRSGYAFLGTGHESVAEHSFGATFIGLVLAHAANIAPDRVVLLCLIHDLHEAATGDFNYVNHRYDRCDAQRAIADMCGQSGLGELLQSVYAEFCGRESFEAQLANDADQLDFICSLRREEDKGNPSATKWLKTAVLRVRTDVGKQLCDAVMQTNPQHWWYDQVDESWWINRDKGDGENGK